MRTPSSWRSSRSSSSTAFAPCSAPAANTDGSGGVPNFRWLKSRLSRIAMTAAELMPEWKMIPNHVGNWS
ncbi:Uncharacterised protein [Mycobacteroides abscessus]|nr:Uncharacterised protein [Mycobacteroides abscessus]